MKNSLYKAFILLLAFTVVHSAFAIGDSRIRIKIDMKQISSSKKVAIIAFTGNSIVVGDMGIGSLVSGALARKKEGDGKLALDQNYMGTLYDLMAHSLTQEGFQFIPNDLILKSKNYQEATTVEMPNYIDGKGLKQMNPEKSDTLKKLAAETGADLFFHISLGHSLGMRGNIGTIVGKQVGIATALITVYDGNGKKLGYIDASEVSEKSVGSVAGGFADPNKIMPLLEDADQQLVSKLAAKISLKK